MISVLLIEDDAWLAESYQRMLGATHEVKWVSSGQEALDHLDEHTPDVIVADLMLGDGIALDVLHEMKTYTDTMTIPTIICSALAANVSLEDVAAYGVVAILDKSSVTPEQLRIAVQRAHVERTSHG